MRTPNLRLHIDDAELIALVEDWNSRGFPKKVITQAALRMMYTEIKNPSDTKALTCILLTEMGRKSQQVKQ